MNYLVFSPVTTDYTTNEVYIIKSWKYYIYCLIFVGINFYRLHLLFLLYLNLIIFESFVGFTFFFLVISLFASWILRIIEGYGNRKQVMEVFESIVEINQALFRIGVVVNFKRLKKIIKYELVIIFVIYCYKRFTSLLYSGKFTIWSFLPVGIFYIFHIFNFYNFIWVVHNCSKLINSRLESLRLRKNYTGTLKQLVLLKHCHGELLTTLNAIRKIFLWQNTSFVIELFAESTQLVYYLLKQMLSVTISNDYSLVARLIFIIWPVILLFFFIFLASSFAILNREIDNGSNVIFELKRKWNCEKLQDEVNSLKNCCLFIT